MQESQNGKIPWRIQQHTPVLLGEFMERGAWWATVHGFSGGASGKQPAFRQKAEGLSHLLPFQGSSLRLQHPFVQHQKIIVFNIFYNIQLFTQKGNFRSFFHIQNGNLPVNTKLYVFTISFSFFFFIYFYELEANYFTILQWVLSYIDMNQPWSYMYSPSLSPLPPPSPLDSSGSSQCTRPKHCFSFF